MNDEFAEQMQVQRALLASLQATSLRMQDALSTKVDTSLFRKSLLLRMTEHLIAAHRAAKIDNDGMTLDVIEDALRHVGRRLAREQGDEQSFSTKRLGHQS